MNSVYFCSIFSARSGLRLRATPRHVARDAEGTEVNKYLFFVERTENKIPKPTDKIIAQLMFSIIGKDLKTKIF